MKTATKYIIEVYKHDEGHSWYFEVYAVPALDLDEPIYVSQFFGSRKQAQAKGLAWILGTAPH